MKCPACERINPDDARYCIYCSAQFKPAAPVVQEATPVTGPTVRLSKQSTTSYTLPTPSASAAASSIPHRVPHAKEMSGALFLLGLGILFLTGTFFPGILVLIGVTSFISEAGSGHQRRALSRLIFFTGLALLFWTHNFFPGIFILIGIMALLNGRKGFCC